jgi:hypothetical protein
MPKTPTTQMIPKQAATIFRPVAGCDAPGLRDERRGWKEWARSLSKFFTFIGLHLEASNLARFAGAVFSGWLPGSTLRQNSQKKQ